jgi:hypothetical protein
VDIGFDFHYQGWTTIRPATACLVIPAGTLEQADVRDRMYLVGTPGEPKWHAFLFLWRKPAKVGDSTIKRRLISMRASLRLPTPARPGRPRVAARQIA